MKRGTLEIGGNKKRLTDKGGKHSKDVSRSYLTKRRNSERRRVKLQRAVSSC